MTEAEPEPTTRGSAAADDPSGRRLAALSLAALGVVYGDIGTSPLYAIRESFHADYGLSVVPDNVLGVLSLVFWALTLIIGVKYLALVLRADNDGEGGILALSALVSPLGTRTGSRRRRTLFLLGLVGASLLYGDGMITPAISVLSAVEGLEVATPVLEPYVVPITVAILVGLFLFQRRGTEGVGKVFGPLTLVWFAMLAALGVYQILQEPGVLRALDPTRALAFFASNGGRGFLVLGSVFLVVTGGEALYTDMGHFGRRPIRLTWFFFVMPALLLNYFGQGALLLRRPEAVESPFYRMGPDWALYPMVAVATIATIIASQAVISGSFSLAMQSVRLGYSPRLRIVHTSESEKGQIYVPLVNSVLMVACIALVVGFGGSSELAGAYGVAVTTTMVITTTLFYVLVRRDWRWPLPLAMAVCGVFLSIDLSFFGANLFKIPDGGWVPLVIAASIFTLMTTWRRGRDILAERTREDASPVDAFMEDVTGDPPSRVPGVAVFMSKDPDNTPPALLHNLQHNRVLHETVILLSVQTEEVPRVRSADRASVESRGEGVYSVVLRYGFMQDVNVPAALAGLDRLGGPDVRPSEVTYFLGRERVLSTRHDSGMARWRERLFVFMSRNGLPATTFFRLPMSQVIELGGQVGL